MQKTTDTSLFTEVTPEESASVNGGYYYSTRYNDNCYRGATRHIVYRRNCDGTFRAVARYW